MNEGLISRRYAKAFFRYATQEQAADLVYEKMKLFLENYTAHPDLGKMLLNPVMSAKDKELLLSTAIGIEPVEVYLRVIRLLIKNHRERYLKTISLLYQRMYRDANGIVKVNIITAVKIGAEQMREVEQIVEKKINGKTPEYEYTIDPSIIGGFILDMETVRYDSSIRNELSKISKVLLS